MGSSGVFSGRETYLTFRDYLPGATQAWIAIQRDHTEMAKTQYSQLSNVVYLPHIGWTLESYHQRVGDVTWLTGPQSGNLSADTGSTFAPNVQAFNAFSQQTISGVTYAPSVQSTGTPMNVARPAAGTDWSTTNLSADQSAFPSPNTAEDFTPMNRVQVTPTYPASGSTAPWDNLTFTCHAPSGVITPRSTIGTFYLNGPAGDACPLGTSQVGVGAVGTGQYSIKVRGDGFAYLYEFFAIPGNSTYTTSNWVPRYSFLWNTGQHALAWTVIQITVQKRMWVDSNGHWLGDTLSFSAGAVGTLPGQTSQVKNLAELAISLLRFQPSYVPTYKVPRLANQPMTVCPVRVDVAIDCRASWYAARHVYKTPGYILDDHVIFEQPVTQSRPINVVWTGVLPVNQQTHDSCGWFATVYDQSGTALTPIGGVITVTTVSGQIAYQQFTPTANMTGAQVKISLSATTDLISAPLITSWAIYGTPIYDYVNPVETYTVPYSQAPPSLYQQSIASVAISPQTTDPGGESATFVVWDMTGELEFLETVNFLPVYLWETDNNPVTNPTGGQVSLFRGYCLYAEGERQRTDNDAVYPGQLWTKWTCHCVGEWARIADATLPVIQVWTDPTTGKNSKVTDAVRNMLESVYPPEMVDVPDNETRFFGTSSATFTQMPGTSVADFCQGSMQDYFGGWCLWDESAGDRGVMRAFLQKTAPYNNLAVFEMDHPTLLNNDGYLYIPQFAGSYPTTVGADNQQVLHTYMQAQTYKPKLERAEGNCVIVYGGGVAPDATLAAGSDSGQFVQIAVNVNSFNFLNLAPTSPGYPNGTDSTYFNRVIPIRAFRYDLPNQNAVDWLCRRIFDRSCYARYFLSFTAPMLTVIDVTDPLQRRPRRLRYYDPVMVRRYDGSLAQFLVVACAPSYEKDAIQMAHYILVTQENIDTKAVIPANSSALRELKKGQQRMLGTDWRNTNATSATQVQGQHIASETMAMPTIPNSPIQQLDPTKPGFGQFFFLNGYSTNGGGDIIR